ncbi:MAG TPA: hypothetical protein PLB88_06615 [Thermoanaerobaculaceae bacterium]|nr:hypothetical protein [Thermoanaerobaculaceae bacterium]
MFRKPAADGLTPEIHTDPRSRIAMYWRLVGLLLIFAIQAGMIAVFLYGIVRLLLVIVRLKKGQLHTG